MNSHDGEPRILPRAEHSISRRNIAKNAVKVLYRLHNAGYKACLVGGSVRDLMLGRTPKDFDAGTDAKPAQIKKLFRNSRIIGRRFRLVHVFFQGEIIEVSTFRSPPQPEEQDSAPDDLLITSDNTFGTPEQDAFRRDFTINALFYNIGDFSVIDYVGGIEDLERRLVRCIGDPNVRFREDPVRMMRACEFAARLGFGIEDRTQEAILSHREELHKASSARLTEELLQLLRCGHAGAAVQWMLDLGMAEILLPEVHDMLGARQRGLGDFARILPVIDRLALAGKDLDDSVLLGALLVARVLTERDEREQTRGGPLRRQEVDELTKETLQPFFDRYRLSNAKCHVTVRALTLFQRLCEPGMKPGLQRRLTQRAGFQDAMRLFDILVDASGEGQEVRDHWQRLAAEVKSAPGGGAEETDESSKPKRRRRRRRRGGKKRGGPSRPAQE